MAPSMSKHVGNVVVFGAPGHTGRFVVSELERRAMKAVLVGRDVEKLSRLAVEHPGVELRVASMDDASSLDRALAGSSLVINCAGPFVDTAEPVIEAALRAHVHYLDVSAEQRVTLATFEHFAAAARAAGVLLIPSMGFFGGLGDLVATAAMGDWISADEIRVVVAMDGWKPTRGTRLTGEKNSGPRSVYSHNVLMPLKGSPSLSWHFPSPFGIQEVVAFPLTETIVISRHLRSPEVHAFLNRIALDDIHNPNTPAPTPVDESGRSDQCFVMEAVVRKGNEERRALVAGQDIYAITAPLVVKAAQQILRGAVRTTGVCAAAEIFSAEPFLRALAVESPLLRLECN
jgi:NAD(P)-dependent dehydrogenase (short-subunit alcohol dehydrogenase family)